MSQIGPKEQKICSGQAFSDGQMDGPTASLITIGRPQSGALIDNDNFTLCLIETTQINL